MSLRDPLAEPPFYEHRLAAAASTLAQYHTLLADGGDPIAKRLAIYRFCDDANAVPQVLYATGEPLPALWEKSDELLQVMVRASTWVREFNRDDSYGSFGFDSFATASQAYAALAIVACLAPKREPLREFLQVLVSREQPDRLFDVLASSFDPSFVRAGVYPKQPWVQSWTDPVLKVLGEPAPRRAALLAEHMKQWDALMRPMGLKARPEGSWDVFGHFAFEVALAVCAFDIDDLAFRDHAHYPRDLVDYYRRHVRGTRDAPRPIGIDSGVTAAHIARPPRADLAKSKRKGLSRWLELVTDGDDRAVAAVLERTGKARKLSDIGGVMAALSEVVAHAVHADVKDDVTVAAQSELLARERDLGEFVPPESPPQGAARASRTLQVFDRWLGERGWRLLDLDNGDDAWHAVAVRTQYWQELLDLSGSLGLRTRPAAEAYAEA